MYNERNVRQDSFARRHSASGRSNLDLSPHTLACRASAVAVGASPSQMPSAQNQSHNPGQSHREDSWGLYERPLGMVYSPCQQWRNIYKEDTALSRGTIFSELDLPFEGKNCRGGK